MLDLSPQVTLILLAVSGMLLVLLIAAMMMRPRVFTQYLEHMTGVKLSPREVAAVFKARGKAGVRDMFLELLIREDLRDGPRITPDTPPDREILVPEDAR